MTWQFQPAQAAFEANRDRWDALNAQGAGHILLDSLFVQCLLKHFGDNSVLLGVEAESSGGMALLQKKSSGIWETFQPSQAPLGLILGDQTGDSAQTLDSLLRSLPGFALQLSVLHQDPVCSTFRPVNHRGKIDSIAYIRTASIPLQGTFDQYWQTREAGLRKNNNRLRRRMAEKGLQLEFVVLRHSNEMADAIREYGCLESKGWKAQKGTAVALDNAQGRFYQELLETFCARNEGVVYQLRVNGKLVASDLCLVRKDMLVLLKTAYDEEWSVYSPSFLLREDIVRLLYAEGTVQTYEFYGPLMDYQLRWTDQVRTLYHVTCYRHGWLRPLKNLATRMRGVK
jgi:CelD/BcsL family acetyltransferase involved in cellulose biosynthesis